MQEIDNIRLQNLLDSMAKDPDDIFMYQDLSVNDSNWTAEEKHFADCMDEIDNANSEESRIIYFDHTYPDELNSSISGITLTTGNGRVLVDEELMVDIPTITSVKAIDSACKKIEEIATGLGIYANPTNLIELESEYKKLYNAAREKNQVNALISLDEAIRPVENLAEVDTSIKVDFTGLEHDSNIVLLHTDPYYPESSISGIAVIGKDGQIIDAVKFDSPIETKSFTQKLENSKEFFSSLSQNYGIELKHPFTYVDDFRNSYMVLRKEALNRADSESLSKLESLAISGKHIKLDELSNDPISAKILAEAATKKGSLIHPDTQKILIKNSQKALEQRIKLIEKISEETNGRFVYSDQPISQDFDALARAMRPHLLKQKRNQAYKELQKNKVNESELFKMEHLELSFKKACTFKDVMNAASNNLILASLTGFFTACQGDFKNRDYRRAQLELKKYLAKSFIDKQEKIVEDYRNSLKEYRNFKRLGKKNSSPFNSVPDEAPYSSSLLPLRFSTEYRELSRHEKFVLNKTKEEFEKRVAQSKNGEYPTMGEFKKVLNESSKVCLAMMKQERFSTEINRIKEYQEELEKATKAKGLEESSHSVALKEGFLKRNKQRKRRR